MDDSDQFIQFTSIDSDGNLIGVKFNTNNPKSFC